MTHYFNQSRRALLKHGAAAVFAGATAPAFAINSKAATRKKVVVTIFQRFGMDGILAVTPYADAGLAKLRPNLMLSAPGSGKKDARIELGNELGLHPAFAAMMPFYQDRRLAIVHGVGQPDPTRSHTQAQRWWETAMPGDYSVSDGWMNRAQGQLKAPAILPSVALGENRPRIFAGHEPVMVSENIAQLLPSTNDELVLKQLQQAYLAAQQNPLQQAGLNSLALGQILKRQVPSRVAYPLQSKLGESLKDIASLIKADVGLQLAFAESKQSPNGKGTWDTHSNASSTDAAGPFPQMANDLSASLAAFMHDLGPYQDDVIVVTHTDFGRNVVENAGQGADHGRATAMFVLGSAIDGGQVYGQLPPLFDKEVLEDGMDLPVTTDFRSVLAPIMHSHLGLDSGLIFPSWHGPDLKVMA